MVLTPWTLSGVKVMALLWFSRKIVTWGKALFELALEFFVVELVDVEKIRLGASFGVVEPVGR